MKKFYIVIFLLITCCLQVLFNNNFGNVTFLWFNYKVTIQASFFIIVSILLFVLLKWFFNICSFSSNLKFIWRRHQEKDLINNLFLVLYYLNIEDRKSLASIINKFDKSAESIKSLPPYFVYLTKYLGSKFLQNNETNQTIITNLLKYKATKLVGLKALIEEKLSENDLESSKDLLSEAKKISGSLPWIIEYEIEIEKGSGNFIKAANKLLSLNRNIISPSNDFQELESLLLEQAESALTRGNLSISKKNAKKMLSLDPLNSDASLLLIDSYIKQRYHWWANHLIRKAWRAMPSKALLDRFRTNNHRYSSIKLLKKQEELLKINSSLNALMALAKSFVEHNQFNKAKEYLAKISSKQKSPEYFKLLSEIELKTGGDPLVISQLLEKT